MPAWTQGDLDKLRSLYPGQTYREVAQILGRTITSVRSKGKVLGLGDRKYWSDDEKARLREMYPTRSNTELAKMFDRSKPAIDAAATAFGLSKTPEYLRQHARLQKGTTAGRAYRFAKGSVPSNKGLRRPGWSVGRMRETQFSKGGRPHNWKPVGTVLADSEGYLRIKIKERGPDEKGWHPAVWPLLHHALWISQNGPVPEGHAIAFKDGNRANVTIENLELVSRGNMARRNAMWNRYPAELAAAIMANAALKRKLRRANNAKQDVGSAQPSV